MKKKKLQEIKEESLEISFVKRKANIFQLKYFFIQ